MLFEIIESGDKEYFLQLLNQFANLKHITDIKYTNRVVHIDRGYASKSEITIYSALIIYQED